MNGCRLATAVPSRLACLTHSLRKPRSGLARLADWPLGCWRRKLTIITNGFRRDDRKAGPAEVLTPGMPEHTASVSRDPGHGAIEPACRLPAPENPPSS
jgi:hypothetical protein